MVELIFNLYAYFLVIVIASLGHCGITVCDYSAIETTPLIVLMI